MSAQNVLRLPIKLTIIVHVTIKCIIFWHKLPPEVVMTVIITSKSGADRTPPSQQRVTPMLILYAYSGDESMWTERAEQLVTGSGAVSRDFRRKRGAEREAADRWTGTDRGAVSSIINFFKTCASSISFVWHRVKFESEQLSWVSLCERLLDVWRRNLGINSRKREEIQENKRKDGKFDVWRKRQV